jgi:hypothetical protein
VHGAEEDEANEKRLVDNETPQSDARPKKCSEADDEDSKVLESV